MLFCWRYWNRPYAMVSAACLLFSMYQFLPLIVFNPQLGSPLALRCMPLLAVIGFLHCAYFSWSPASRLADVAATLLQVLLIVFVLHIRSTALWQVIGVGLMFAWAAASHRWRSRVDEKYSMRRIVLLSAFPLAALTAGWGTLNVYRQAVFAKEYLQGDQTVTRVTWHNIYAGLALHPELAEKAALRIDDVSIVVAAGRYLKEAGQYSLWKEIGGESENFSRIRWARYDLVVRDMLVATCKAEPIMCAEAFVWYKPLYYADTLLWYYGFIETPKVSEAFVSTYFGDVVKRQLEATNAQLRKHQLTAAPWSAGFALVWFCLVVAVILTGARLAIANLACMAAAVLASSLPSIVGYPAPLGMIDSGVVCSAMLQLLFVVLPLSLPVSIVLRDQRTC
jgi:hypothetical protein